MDLHLEDLAEVLLRHLEVEPHQEDSEVELHPEDLEVLVLAPQLPQLVLQSRSFPMKM